MWFIYFINGFIDGAWNMSGVCLIVLSPLILLYKYLERKENDNA